MLQLPWTAYCCVQWPKALITSEAVGSWAACVTRIAWCVFWVSALSQLCERVITTGSSEAVQLCVC